LALADWRVIDRIKSDEKIIRLNLCFKNNTPVSQIFYYSLIA